MLRTPEVERELGRRGYYFGHDWAPAEGLELAYQLGIPRGDHRDARIVRTIAPQDRDSARNTLSSRYGFGPFPLHTETAYWRTPVRWLLLRCLAPGSASRATTVVDTELLRISPRLLRLMCNEIWIVAARRPFLATVARPPANGHPLAIRFDRDCMRPLTRGARDLAAILDTLLSEIAPIEVTWSTDDLLVVDNYRCLHGRGSASSPDPDRVLERILVGEKL